MSSEVKIKVEPGTLPPDVAGSVGVGTIARSASGERRGVLEAEQEPKVKVEHDTGERAVERTLSFSNEETKAEDVIPPKSKQISKRIEAKNAQAAKRAADRRSSARQGASGARSGDGYAQEVVDNVDSGPEGPYVPDLVSPYKATHSSVIIWNAGQLANLTKSHKILKPLRIQLPPRIWGPVPKPEFENIVGEDRDLAMSFIVHTLLCGGFGVKQSDLPLTADGAPYYHAFTFAELRGVGMAVFNALANLVGSILSNFTSRVAASHAGSDLGSLTDRLAEVAVQDPYSTPVKIENSHDLDVVMESVQRIPAPEGRPKAIRVSTVEDPRAARPMLPGHTLISVKSKDQVDREKEEKRKSKPKKSNAKPKYESGSGSDDDGEDPYDEIYLGQDSDDERYQAPVIRAASTMEIKNFSGRDMDAERAKAWIHRLCRKGRMDRLSPREMRDLFSDRLTGGAKSWYQQLPQKITRDWSSTVDESMYQYCEIGVKPAEHYYTMTRRDGELPIEYLYRLNVAAKKAKVQIRGRIVTEKAHVDRFVRSVDDEDLVRSLSLQRIRSVDELEDALKKLGRHTRRPQGRERDSDARIPAQKNFAPSKTSYPGKKPASEPGSKARPIPVKSVRWPPKGATVSRSDPRSSDSEGEDQGDYGSGDSDDAGSSDEDRYEARQVAVVQESTDPSSRGHGRPRSPCTICGSECHSDANCWKNLRCDRCDRMGHPSDRCREVCKACDQVHAKGECALEALYNKLAAWYNPSRHAGLLPPEVEKALN